MEGEMNWETREKDSDATMQAVLKSEKKLKQIICHKCKPEIILLHKYTKSFWHCLLC